MSGLHPIFLQSIIVGRVSHDWPCSLNVHNLFVGSPLVSMLISNIQVDILHPLASVEWQECREVPVCIGRAQAVWLKDKVCLGGGTVSGSKRDEARLYVLQVELWNQHLPILVAVTTDPLWPSITSCYPTIWGWRLCCYGNCYQCRMCTSRAV